MKRKNGKINESFTKSSAALSKRVVCHTLCHRISRNTTFLAMDSSHEYSPTASYVVKLGIELIAGAGARRAALAQEHWQILKMILGVRFTICTDI